MLHAGHDVVALDALDGRHRHLPQQVGILAVGLLGPAPAGMAEDVDADAAVEVGALGPQLLADGVGHAALETAVEGGAASHGHRERRGVVQDHALRTVGEEQGRDEQPRVGTGRDRSIVELEALDRDVTREIEEPEIARHLVDLLLEAHRREEKVHVVFDRSFGEVLAPGKIGELEDIGARGPHEQAVRPPFGVRPEGHHGESQEEERHQPQDDSRSEAEPPAHVHQRTTVARVS